MRTRALRRRTFSRFLRSPILAIIMLVLFSALGATGMAMASSQENNAVAVVQARTVVSTGLVYGSEKTLVEYRVDDQKRFALVSGGPYFANDIVDIEVDSEGGVVEKNPQVDVIFLWIVTFLMLIGVSIMAYLIYVMLSDL